MIKLYEDYIISLMRHALYLSTNLYLLAVKMVAKKKRTSNITIYGYNRSNNDYCSLPSKADCLDNKRNTNIRTINKRIDKDILYNYLQTKPFLQSLFSIPC